MFEDSDLFSRAVMAIGAAHMAGIACPCDEHGAVYLLVTEPVEGLHTVFDHSHVMLDAIQQGYIPPTALFDVITVPIADTQYRSFARAWYGRVGRDVDVLAGDR